METIKELYQQIDDKDAFIGLCCAEFGGKPKSKKHHWFCDSGFWSVPDKILANVISLAERTINEQNKVVA